jgi:hypothetical protein
MRLHVVPGTNPITLAAGDLARAASAVVCTPVAYARFVVGAGEAVEAFHGLAGDDCMGDDAEAVRAFARMAALQTDPLAIADLATAPSLPPALDHERTQWRWCGGVPFFGRDGHVTGVVCVFDRVARSGAKPALERLAALVRGFDPHATAHDIEPGDDVAPEDERAFATLAFLAGGVARELEERLVRIADGSEALRAHRGTGDSRVAASILSRDAARALELLRHLRALVEAREAA